MTDVKLTLVQVPGSPPALDGSTLAQLGLNYANIFSGPPWNEYTYCQKDRIYFGRETSPDLPCACGAPLELAYPVLPTQRYIRKELERPDAALWLVRTLGGATLGFSWGSTYYSPEEFVEHKYRTKEMREAITETLRASGVTGAMFYLSESGLLPEARGRGVSHEMHRLRLERATELGLPAVQRTIATGPMYRTSLRAGMTQVMGPIAEVDTAARRIIVTDDLVNGFEDLELPNRVLFVKSVDCSTTDGTEV